MVPSEVIQYMKNETCPLQSRLDHMADVIGHLTKLIERGNDQRLAIAPRFVLAITGRCEN